MASLASDAVLRNGRCATGEWTIRKPVLFAHVQRVEDTTINCSWLAPWRQGSRCGHVDIMRQTRKQKGASFAACSVKLAATTASAYRNVKFPSRTIPYIVHGSTSKPGCDLKNSFRASASVPNRPATGSSSYSSPRPSRMLSFQI